ncbi:MAG TPA: hypothetical protein DEP03_09545, partial [Massilia sp.]|nr:hypothetical protein [Massilia sp.]
MRPRRIRSPRRKPCRPGPTATPCPRRRRKNRRWRSRPRLSPKRPSTLCRLKRKPRRRRKRLRQRRPTSRPNRQSPRPR